MVSAPGSNEDTKSEVVGTERHQTVEQTQLDEKLTRWTIMVYIAADAVLANFGVESLKQLNEGARSIPDKAAKAKVVVASQFSIDAPGGQHIPRYVFDKKSGCNLGQSLKGHLDATDDMTEQEALTDFLQWVYDRKDCEADNYALILWSHGPQLFLQPPPGRPTGSTGSLYLTPIELQHALQDGFPPAAQGKLKVIGFDACSMSMLEMAYEIRNLTQYMVASQQEVPDLSFPYSTLVQQVRKFGDNAETLLKKSVSSYISEYQDYITDEITNMQPVTLTALRLSQFRSVFEGIQDLAVALLAGKDDSDLPDYLIKARENSRDYAGGLYVDLVEFCTYLYQQLYPCVADDQMPVPASETNPGTATPTNVEEDLWDSQISIQHKVAIRNACLKVLDALRVDVHDMSNGVVLINCSEDTRSHGVSLYLPYLSDEQVSIIEQPMVKGGRDGGIKGFSLAINATTPGYLLDRRQELILETEGYYGKLALAIDTRWYDFITGFWTRILIDLCSGTLNLRYSAAQSAINAVKKTKAVKT